MFSLDQHRLKLLLALVLLGLLGDALLRVFPWGLNAFVWFALVLALHLAYRKGVGANMTPGLRWIFGTAFFFALLIAWRDAPALRALNILIVLTSISIAAALAANRDVRHAWITEYLTAAVETLKISLTVPWKAAPQFAESIRSREATTTIPFLSILRGFLIAVPLLIGFGGFFFSADATFEKLVNNTFDFNIYNIAKHALVACSCAWFATAVVGLCLHGPGRALERQKPFFRVSFGAIEVNVALTLINLLFLTFVVIQFQYFFGAHQRVINETALTYSEYARRGFFELAAVATLALILLLTCGRLVDASGPADKRLFAALGCTLIALVLVILASSLHRMSIYIDVYGLTRLRLYTAAFSIWLGVVYLWLAGTFLRNRGRDFAFGFLLSGYAAAFLLQGINPDAIIIRVNVARFHDGKSFDKDYALSLSADAIPELIEALPTMPLYLQREMKPVIAKRWLDTDPPARDLRTWNWAGHIADKAVQRSAAFEPK